MKKIIPTIFLSLALICAALSHAQFNGSHKLRMAEAAIAQFYVDTVNETHLVETAIKSCILYTSDAAAD